MRQATATIQNHKNKEKKKLNLRAIFRKTFIVQTNFKFAIQQLFQNGPDFDFRSK